LSYIHKTSFDIIQGANIDDELENYFEVDEPIALTIQGILLCPRPQPTGTIMRTPSNVTIPAT
jgi:hypothetical protein